MTGRGAIVLTELQSQGVLLVNAWKHVILPKCLHF